MEGKGREGAAVVAPRVTVLPCPRRNKRRILRIFTLPPAAEAQPEPNFYNNMKKIRLRQQLEMYSIGKGSTARPREGSCVGRPCRAVTWGLACVQGFRRSPGRCCVA